MCVPIKDVNFTLNGFILRIDSDFSFLVFRIVSYRHQPQKLTIT